MTLTVNGAAHTVPDGTTVSELLRSLDLDRDGIAVAVDTRVVPRSEHPRRTLHDGAAVEVIKAVGGG